MNILDRTNNMKLVSSNKGGEYHGPCPKCTPADKLSSSNRLHIWPNQDEGRGSYWCRGCDKGGDAIQWLRDMEGMSYKQACIEVGKEYNPKLDTKEPTAMDKQKQFVPCEHKAVNTEWRERAERFVEWSHDALCANDEMLQWLSDERGISYETVKELKLGYNKGDKGKDLYRPRSSWGLPESYKEDGKAKKLWLPVGITIPWYAEDGLCRVRIRRATGDPRYYVVPGSIGSPMLLDSTHHRAWKTIIVVESELDAIMLHSQAKHLAVYLAIGSSHTKPDAEVVSKIIEQQRGKGQAIQIKVALDNDDAGQKGANWWIDTFGATLHNIPSGNKDPGEVFKSKINITEWIEAALPAAYSITKSESVYVYTQKTINPPPLLQSMKDKKGRDYTITDDVEIWRQKQQSKETCFSIKEIEMSKQAVAWAGDLGQNMADCIMECKQVFAGSYVKKVTDLR